MDQSSEAGMKKIPPNASIGEGTVISGSHCFSRFLSRKKDALRIGKHCTLDGVHFALGPDAKVIIGDYCYFTNALLLSEIEVRIGSYVMIGWNATIADSDFHPMQPAARIVDAVACSPLGRGTARPEIKKLAVTIGDDVWIGPNATILKGVTIGSGAFIEAGALITRDVPKNARMIGNPAQRIEGDSH